MYSKQTQCLNEQVFMDLIKNGDLGILLIDDENEYTVRHACEVIADGFENEGLTLVETAIAQLRIGVTKAAVKGFNLEAAKANFTQSMIEKIGANIADFVIAKAQVLHETRRGEKP